MIWFAIADACASTWLAESFFADSNAVMACAICASTSALALSAAAATSASIFAFIAATSFATSARAFAMTFSFSAYHRYKINAHRQSRALSRASFDPRRAFARLDKPQTTHRVRRFAPRAPAIRPPPSPRRARRVTKKLLARVFASLARVALAKRTINASTSAEFPPTAASCDRMSSSRSSSAFPTGPNTVLSRIVISSKNSVAMIGSVRSKSNSFPASACAAGTAHAICAASVIAGSLTRSTTAATGALTAVARVAARFAGAGALAAVIWIARAATKDISFVDACVCAARSSRARATGAITRAIVGVILVCANSDETRSVAVALGIRSRDSDRVGRARRSRDRSTATASIDVASIARARRPSRRRSARAPSIDARASSSSSHRDARRAMRAR